MRSTVEFDQFRLWRDPAVLDTLVRAEYLTTARFEPILRRQLGYAILDLLFESGDESVVVACTFIDMQQLITRSDSPFLYGPVVASLPDAGRFAAIEALVLPWLRTLIRGRGANEERVRSFAASPLFESARAACLLGAAPLAHVIPRMAPFIYARRFVRDAAVRLACADAALGSAILSDVAASIASDRTDSLADRWYGKTPMSAPPIDRADVVISGESGHLITVGERPTGVVTIPVPRPVPMDLLFTFDAADAPAVTTFRVEAHEAPLRVCKDQVAVPVIGGSSGRIAIALRAVTAGINDADRDEALELERRLRAEGIDAFLVFDPANADLATCDLVHIIGGVGDDHVRQFAQRAQRERVPYVIALTPVGSLWPWAETTLHVALALTADDRKKNEYMRTFARKQLVADRTVEPPVDHVAQIERDFAAVASGASAVFTAPGDDIAAVRARFASVPAERILARGQLVGPEPAPSPIASIVPKVPFVLIDAPFMLESHSLFGAYALGRADIPTVIAGSVHDVSVLEMVRLFAPEAVVIADPEPGVLAALYRRAAAWLDCAPAPTGLSRLVRALRCGAVPVVPNDRQIVAFGGIDLPTYTPTSFEDCASAVASAMHDSNRAARVERLYGRFAPMLDQRRAFLEILDAYASVAVNA